ncbi:MAG: formate dehydrogenase subunit gamma [Hyphomicrobium sp.]
MAKQKGSSKAAPAEKPAPTAAEVRVLAICGAHGNRPDELLEILHDIQHELGHVPEAILPIIANALNRSRAEIHGVVTFYHDFRREPAGRHAIKICRAEACQSMGTEQLCQHAETSLGTSLGSTSADGKYTLDAVYCLGNCALSPAVLIGDQLYGKVTPQRFDEIVATLGKEKAR